MSNQVVTIGYLKEFVSGKLTVNTNKPDTYCPTYAELTGGSLVKNYSAGANPKDTVNGIDIPNCTVNIGYKNNQLVIRQDLLLKYMVLDSIAITADSTSISQCGGQTNVCVKGTFHLETKSEGGSIAKGGSETDSTIKATWSGDADNSGPSTCTVISFGENTVGGYGTSNPTTAPSRNESTTATYTYKGTNLTSVNDTTKTSNTVTITQAANNVHDWYYEGKTDYATSLVASCPGNVSENGGTATVTSTLYYEQDWRCDDDCGNTVGYKYVSASKSGPSTSVTFAEQDCDEPERCETVSLSMSGQSTSCSVCQDESSVPCYCGENCAGNCNTTIHWHCAEKQSYTNMGTTYTINGLDGDGCLPCTGGTATVIIHGTTDTELYTRAAECRTATLSTTMGKTADQTVVGLVQSYTGETGSGTYYDYLYGRSYTVPTNKYTAYTQYHYMAYNTAGKHNRNETTYQYDTLGTSYKYEVLEYSFNDYYISSKKFYNKSDFVDEGNSAATWDAAMERYYDSATCSGGTGDDCSGGTWVYDEDLNPNETGITGTYKVWFTNYTNFSKMDDEMMDSVPNVCYVASISPDKTMFYSASTSNNSMIKTFEFAANTTTAATNGSVTFTSDNPSVGNSPNKIEKITVNYKVAACTNNTDKYTLKSVTADKTEVACNAIPGNGVTITVNGEHSIIKVSQADPSISGETTPSAYTMTQGTDYTMSYDPTGSNTGSESRTVTVTITGKGKFSGQTKTVSYTQKADANCFTGTTCTPSTSYTYSNYSVSYNGGAVNCNAEPSKSKITVTADKTTTTKDVFCQESSTTDNGVSITDFSVSYSPSGNNTGTSNRTVTGTVTHNGSTAGTFTFTQNSGSTCQATVTSTTYAYRIDAADFDACESETTVTVYATPTYYYSDGSNAKGEETEISVLYTLTYRLGTGTSVATASQNSTSDSRVWTVTASFKHNNSDHTANDTATQSAGPCKDSCTCSVTSISVSPSAYTFTSSTENKSFTVTIVDNSSTCSNCDGGFKVYDSNGLLVESGTTSFTLSNQSGTFTIKANDNTGKTCTLTTTEYTAPSSTCVIGETITSNGGTSSTATVGKGGTKTLTIYTKEDGMFSMVSVEPDSYDSDLVSIENTASSQTEYHTTWVLTGSNSKTGSTDITFKNGCGEYVVPFEVTAATQVTYSYSGTAENFGSCATSTTVKVYEKASTASTWTDITSNVTPTLKYKTNSTSYATAATPNGGSTSVVWSVQITFNRRNESRSVVANATQDAGPCPDLCTCSVTNISVSPSAHTFTSEEDYEFTVTITDNSSTCSKCNGGFKVYDSNGLVVESGTTSFTLSNQSGTFTIKANDDTEKTCTLITTKYTAPEPVYVMQKTSADTSTTITYPGGTTYLPYPGYICCYSTKDGEKQSVTAISDSTWLTVSENNESPYNGANYNFKFDQTENTSTSSRTGKITITQSGSNKKVVWTIVQAGKPEDETGTTTEYNIVISGNTEIEACAETFPTYGIYGISRTGITHTDTSKDTEWDDWSSGVLLLPAYFTKTVSPSAVTKNTTTSTKTYTITATGKTGTVYSGIVSNTFTMTQAANCKTGGTHVNNINISFPTDYGGRVCFTVTVNGTDITSTVVASTSLNYSSLGGNVYDFSKPSATTSTPYGIVPLSFNTNDGDSVTVTVDANAGHYTSYGSPLASSTSSGSNIGTYTSTGNRNMSITVRAAESTLVSIGINVVFPHMYGGYVFGFSIMKNNSPVTPSLSSSKATLNGSTLHVKNLSTILVSFNANVGDTIEVSFTNGGVYTASTATNYIAVTCQCGSGCQTGTYCMSSSGIVNSGSIVVTSDQRGGTITLSQEGGASGGGGLTPMPDDSGILT